MVLSVRVVIPYEVVLMARHVGAVVDVGIKHATPRPESMREGDVATAP